MSVLIPTDFRHGWIIFGPLADKNTWKVALVELPASEKFSRLFCTCFEISVWNLVYKSSRWCHMSSSSFIPIWTLWPTLQPKIGQSHLSAFKLYRGLRFGTHTQIVSALRDWFSSCLGNFWPSGGQKHSIGGVNRAPSQRKVLQTFFFYMFGDMNLKPGIFIQQVARHMRFEFHHNEVSASGEFSGLFKCFDVSASKFVYTLSRLHNILSSCFTRMGSLWLLLLTKILIIKSLWQWDMRCVLFKDFSVWSVFIAVVCAAAWYSHRKL